MEHHFGQRLRNYLFLPVENLFSPDEDSFEPVLNLFCTSREFILDNLEAILTS